MDGIAELAGAVVGLMCGDLLKGVNGFDEAVFVYWFADGPVMPCVESVEVFAGGLEVFGEVSPSVVGVVGAEFSSSAVDLIAGDRP